MSNIEEIRSRVQKEHATIIGNLTKLSNFLNKFSDKNEFGDDIIPEKTFDDLEGGELMFELMVEQEDYMRHYAEVLHQRLILLTPTENE